ncbi:MAG TPA: phosphoribosylpyrophosphate synthetase, partial [Eubacterium sp.]|nr:phosphoribosylpyrophosphate synthetase [Eubacterium sp.]
DEYFAKEYITRVIVTNLNYTRPEVDDRSYILKADMTRYLSTIIDTFNHDISTKKVVDPTLRIRDLVEEYNKRGLNV